MTAFLLTEQDLRDKAGALPALPVVATELLASLDEDDIDVATLARHITSDQSLAARALRVANSPFYGMAGRVTTIQDAVVILGFRAVRSLVLSSLLVKAVDHVGGGQKNSRGFWRHAVAVALCARGLARFSGTCVDTAFTAGLLHDIGRIFLAACFPEHTRAAHLRQQEMRGAFIQAEHEVLGLDHGVAGGVLARQWGFPSPIADAIARHHDPDQGDAAELTDLCHGADILAHALDVDGHAHAAVPQISGAAWARLEPDWKVMSGLMRRVEADLEDTCLALLP